MQRKSVRKVCRNFIRLYRDKDMKSRREDHVVFGPVDLSKGLGISRTQVYLMLDCKANNISLKTMSKIANYFDVSIEELLK